MARGTAVHKAAEALARGERATNSPETAPYVAGVTAWFGDFRPTILFAERRVVSESKRNTGRIDLGVLIADDPVIVDVKTSDSTSPWHGIQVAAYQDLANDDPETQQLLREYREQFGFSRSTRTWQRAILYLRSNGKYDWRGPLDLLRRGPTDAQLYRSALALLAWKYDHGLIKTIDRANPDLA